MRMALGIMVGTVVGGFLGCMLGYFVACELLPVLVDGGPDAER